MSTIITNNPYTFTVLDNMNINAVFEDNTATITVYKYPSVRSGMDTGITISGGGTKTIGSTCTLTATNSISPSVFGTYYAWLDLETGNVLGTNSTLSFTVSKDQTIYCALIRNDSTKDNLYFRNRGVSTATQTFTVGLRDGTTKTLTLKTNGAWTTDTTIKQYNIVSVSSPNAGIMFGGFYHGFNLVNDSSHPLKNYYTYPDAEVASSSTSCYYFSPRNGSIIYLDSATPWGSRGDTPSHLVFQQKYAPDFNVAMDIQPTTVHYPSYGVGYDSDWVARNFTSNTPTLVKDNNY